MMDTRMIIILLMSMVITFGLRSLPFFAFHGEKKMPLWLEKLGKSLPTAIMAILVIYCCKDVGDNFFNDGIFKLLAVVLVAGTYKLKHSTFISILSGTAFYMLMLYFFG